MGFFSREEKPFEEINSLLFLMNKKGLNVTIRQSPIFVFLQMYPWPPLETPGDLPLPQSVALNACLETNMF